MQRSNKYFHGFYSWKNFFLQFVRANLTPINLLPFMGVVYADGDRIVGIISKSHENRFFFKETNIYTT